jgi:hypothetical protein
MLGEDSVRVSVEIMEESVTGEKEENKEKPKPRLKRESLVSRSRQTEILFRIDRSGRWIASRILLMACSPWDLHPVNRRYIAFLIG